MSVIELLVAHREEVNQKKLQIAEMSLNIVENPYDNVRVLHMHTPPLFWVHVLIYIHCIVLYQKGFDVG